MNKTEIKQCINETIVPNNEHGITAESLNLILNEMVDNSGESGSGDGALRVIVPDMIMLGPEIVAMGELSPAVWEEMKSLAEADEADMSEYDAVIKASFEHNANVAQQILEKAKEGQGVSVVLDQTPYFPVALNIQFQMAPELAAFYEDVTMCGTQPAGLIMEYMKPTPEGESMFEGNFFSCALAPAGNIDHEGRINYPSNMLIKLNLDGSLTFTQIEEEQPSSGSGALYLNEDSSHNQEVYNVVFSALSNMEPCPQILMIDSELCASSITVWIDNNLVQNGVAISFYIPTDGGYVTFILAPDGSITPQSA